MKKSKTEIVEFLGEIDLFICSSGFEDRSVFLTFNLLPANVDHSIVFHLNENYEMANENIKKLQQRLCDIQVINYPRNNPIQTFDTFHQVLNSKIEDSDKTKMHLVIDVTTFTREVLLILMKVLSLNEFYKAFNVDLIYTPAESYPNEWLTKGVREIRSIFGYLGLISPSKKSILVILNGFETERTEEIINAFEPYRIVLGKPTEIGSINGKLNSIGCTKFQYIKDKYYNLILDEFEFSCTDIKETENSLNNIIEKYQNDYNIILSPLNNKISTIASAFVGLKNEQIQICYASANQYNIYAYSKGCDYFIVNNYSDLLIENH